MMCLVKRTIIVFLTAVVMNGLFSGVSHGAPIPDGFVGVPWGASRDQILKAMNERGFTTQGTIVGEGTPPSTLLFRGAFGGRNCQLEFYLLNNTLHRGRATYLGMFEAEPAKEGIYKQIVSQISVKYGPPHSDKIDAIKGNDGKIYRFGRATWEFIDSDSSEKYGISIDLLPTGFNYFSQYGKSFGYVSIEYTADSLAERLKTKDF